MDVLLSKLEYNQIIQIIEQYCKIYLGKKICFELEPSFQFENDKFIENNPQFKDDTSNLPKTVEKLNITKIYILH